MFLEKDPLRIFITTWSNSSNLSPSSLDKDWKMDHKIITKFESYWNCLCRLGGKGGGGGGAAELGGQ